MKVTLSVVPSAASAREMVVVPSEKTPAASVSVAVMSSVRSSLRISIVSVCGVPTVVENVLESSATMTGFNVDGAVAVAERLTVTGSAPALESDSVPENVPAAVGVKVTLSVVPEAEAVCEMVVVPS